MRHLETAINTSEKEIDSSRVKPLKEIFGTTQKNIRMQSQLRTNQKLYLRYAGLSDQIIHLFSLLFPFFILIFK